MPGFLPNTCKSQKIPYPFLVFRKLRRFALLFFTIYVTASLAAAIFLSEGTIHLQRRPIRHQAEFAQVVQQQFKANLEDANVFADDGTTLKGWYVKPSAANGSSVILLHGVTDNREGVAGYARMFLNHGYTVLLPDARAHGESGGQLATYGIKERYDILRWTNWLQQRSPGCVYLFGESMGAAIALQATAVTPKLCGAVVESPYSTFREIAHDRIARHGHTPVWFVRIAARPMLEIAFLYTRLRYGIDLTEADPHSALAQSRVPTLLIAGTADRNIPARHAVSIMKVANSHAELWIVNGADHGGAVAVAPSEFEQKVVGWFDSHGPLRASVAESR